MEKEAIISFVKVHVADITKRSEPDVVEERLAKVIKRVKV